MGATASASRPDRRLIRRSQTLTQILDVALAVMGEEGVAGLSLGEVARRLGMRPPSLYEYFASKHALYDALFERGAQAVLDTMEAELPRLLTRRNSAERILLAGAELFVRWTLENQVYAQLLYWRPVPGFRPSARALAPALRLVEDNVEAFLDLQRRGLLSQRVPARQMERDWTVLIAGVVSQQLSNAPEETFEEARFVRALPQLVRMFTSVYGASRNRPANAKRLGISRGKGGSDGVGTA